jgi:hypothetical protein
MLVPFVLLFAAIGAGCGGGDKKDEKAAAGSGDGNAQDNGLADKSPREILTAAVGALRGAKSVHFEGKESVEKKPTSVKADLEQPSKIRVSFDENGAAASLIAVSGSLYIKANETFWRKQHAAKAGKLLADRWFKAPGTSASFRDLTKGLDFGTLSRCLNKDHGTIAGGGTDSVDGQPAVVIVDKGDRPGTSPGKLWVATRGKPYPLKVLTTGKQRSGGKRDPECDSEDSPDRPGDQITFSKWDEPAGIAAPPNAVDFNRNSAAS